MNIFTNDLGIDLGTANVLINVDGPGILLQEPSVVAMDKNSGRIVRVGLEARNMLGRTPGNLVAMRPLKDGVISDHEMTVKLLQELFKKVSHKSLLKPKPRVVICVPSGVTEVEERTVINAALEAGARRVYLIEEPLAAALGANLDISGPKGHMVVDIGAGTTDTAVLTMNGVAASSSIKVAGNAFDEAIARQIRRKYGLIIGNTIAEEIKIKIGRAWTHSDVSTMLVTGRDAKSGMARQQEISSEDFVEPLNRLCRQIADEVLSLLESTTPELVSDVAESGITLTGGGSQLWGMAQAITERTNIPCTVADDPLKCVAYGCGKSLKWIRHMQEGTINIARRRAMRG